MSEPVACWYCKRADADYVPCCSSHGKSLCCPCYRRLHFVERPCGHHASCASEAPAP